MDKQEYIKWLIGYKQAYLEGCITRSELKWHRRNLTLKYKDYLWITGL